MATENGEKLESLDVKKERLGALLEQNLYILGTLCQQGIS